MQPKARESECVKVIIRCRPMSGNEIQAGHQVVVEMRLKNGDIFVRKPYCDEPPKQFTFDSVFDWTSS